MIGDEDPHVETDNLLELNIPDHLREKFHQIDRKEEEEAAAAVDLKNDQ